MDNERQIAFKLIALVLGYPDGERFRSNLQAAIGCARTLSLSPARTWLLQAMETLSTMDGRKLRRQYVQSFDFREQTCLYLTAHEYGDSRRRGVALIELNQLLRQAGFEFATSDLPDFMPPLFEFLSAKPSNVDTSDLEKRMAAVCHRILDNLSDGHPYAPVFCAAISVLPAVNYAGEAETFPLREQGDTDADTMPYPLEYE